jgi:hypothetical protein
VRGWAIPAPIRIERYAFGMRGTISGYVKIRGIDLPSDSEISLVPADTSRRRLPLTHGPRGVYPKPAAHPAIAGAVVERLHAKSGTVVTATSLYRPRLDGDLESLRFPHDVESLGNMRHFHKERLRRAVALPLEPS